jgi:hypothetical protein
MARKQTRSRAERLTHPLLEKLGAIPAAAEIFVHSVKIVCGKQIETNCGCVAGARPGVYATEVNIQNLDLGPRPALVVKAVLPLINSGAVVAREPNVAVAPNFLRWERRWTIVAASRSCCWARPRAETPGSPSAS